MNNLEKNKNGFTLIEIALVLVIVGVLAAVALPSLFRQIERNRSQAAINTINYIRTALETCGVEYLYKYSTSCLGWTPLNILNPSDSTFTYSYTATDETGGTNTGGYVITANRSNLGVDTIVVTKDSGSGLVSCQGTGVYTGVC